MIEQNWGMVIKWYNQNLQGPKSRFFPLWYSCH